MEKSFPCDAADLPAAHSRFDRLYRLVVVKILNVNNGGSEAEKRYLTDMVQWLFRGCPNAEQLRLNWTGRPSRMRTFLCAVC